MKMKYLFGACMLLGSLASCTNDEIVSTGGSIETPGSGAVVFSLEGLGSGSVENPATRTILATQEENRIDSLDIYVFAYDNDGTFDEDLASTEAGVIAQLTPDDAATANETHWYLQEKWTWKNPEPGRSSGVVDTSRPQLHEIAQLGGNGVARTAVIYPARGRFLKFFIVANGGELTATAAETAYTPAFTDATAGTIGTAASDFLNLRLCLGIRPADPTQVLSIECSLPMTAQMATTAATAVNMTATANPVQITRGATLTRAVTRFDVVNFAALPSQGDYTLTDVIVSNHYSFTNMQNLVPAAAAMKAPVKKNLDGRTWSPYTDPTTRERGMQLQSVFYTSPTLAGTDPMKLGLRGVLGKTNAQPGELLTPLNKDVNVVNGDGNTIVLQANYRYLLKISKLGSDINVIFSILDWDSKILDGDFSNAPMPELICENAAGITWNVTDPDMNLHFVEMSNTAVGGRLAFELGTYTEDELADLLTDPTNPEKIPFEVRVFSLNDNPAFPDDNIWLATPVITFDPVKRDRFNVVLDIRPETEVPLNVRPDLLVKIANKEHAEKQLFFRVSSTWQAPVRPLDIVDVGDFNVGIGDNTLTAWQTAQDNAPDGWEVPTRNYANRMAGVILTNTPVAVSTANFFNAFPAASSTRAVGEARYWLLDEDPQEGANAFALVVAGNMASIQPLQKTDPAKVRYVKPKQGADLTTNIAIDAANAQPASHHSVAPLKLKGYQGAYKEFKDAAGNEWGLPTIEAIKYMARYNRISYDPITRADFLAAFPKGYTYWTSSPQNENSDNMQTFSIGNDNKITFGISSAASGKATAMYIRFDTPPLDDIASTPIGTKTGGTIYMSISLPTAKIFSELSTACPEGWSIPTKDQAMNMLHLDSDSGEYNLTETDIADGVWYSTIWTQTAFDADNGWAIKTEGNKVSLIAVAKTEQKMVRCVKVAQ